MSEKTSGGYGTTKGGEAATIPTTGVGPAMLAPSESGEANRIQVPLTPIACWRVDDIRFEFGSSFLQVAMQEELSQLKALCEQFATSPLTLFGHADPVGADSYNKALSGRRAGAIYGLLVRKAEIWEDIYSNQGGYTGVASGDVWGLKSVQLMLTALGFNPGAADGAMGEKTQSAVKEFQAQNGLSVDGDPGPLTRNKLFLAYMDLLAGADFRLESSRFLAQGAHSAGKGDFQGCGEFNPVLLFSAAESQAYEEEEDKAERDTENAPNRRVVAYFFLPGSRVDPEKWPCPAAKDGDEGCRKRFWSNGDSRRTFGEARREFKDTQDTFACRFYQRLTESSPCEKGAPIPPNMRFSI